MIFNTPSWTPQLSIPIPESNLVGDFVMERDHKLYRWSDDAPSIVCALSGKSYNMREIRDQVSYLSRGLAKRLAWSPNKGSPRGKVVGILSYNTIDLMIACWAVHRVGGICLLLHSTSSASEVQAHLERADCTVMFSCKSLVPTCLEASKTRSMEIYQFDVPNEPRQPLEQHETENRLSQLVAEGSQLGPVENAEWHAGQGREQVAYLCPTSGTSGKQKLAQLTHFNVIANVVQAATFEYFSKQGHTETALGILPLSHSYGLVLGHLLAWRGDCIILHPRFDMQVVLASIARYSIERLYLVPSIIAALATNPFLFDIYDVSSVKAVVSGSASFGPRMAEALQKVQPTWQILPGYGLTETGVIISFTSAHNIYLGSDGCLLPMVQGKLAREDGTTVDSYGSSGELLLRSPSIMAGYLGDEAANRSTFDEEGWLRTGDVATFKKDDSGTEHLFIVDRKKDIMKVKGLQVAPAEIEQQLFIHPAIDEAAVISVADEDAGERPFAFIVRSHKNMVELDEKALKADINKHIEKTMSEPHWLRGNISFEAEIPKSHNGKALKFKLKALHASKQK